MIQRVLKESWQLYRQHAIPWTLPLVKPIVLILSSLYGCLIADELFQSLGLSLHLEPVALLTGCLFWLLGCLCVLFYASWEYFCCFTASCKAVDLAYSALKNKSDYLTSNRAGYPALDRSAKKLLAGWFMVESVVWVVLFLPMVIVAIICLLFALTYPAASQIVHFILILFCILVGCALRVLTSYIVPLIALKPPESPLSLKQLWTNNLQWLLKKPVQLVVVLVVSTVLTAWVVPGLVKTAFWATHLQQVVVAVCRGVAGSKIQQRLLPAQIRYGSNIPSEQQVLEKIAELFIVSVTALLIAPINTTLLTVLLLNVQQAPLKPDEPVAS
jgi:hypothetical protein